MIAINTPVVDEDGVRSCCSCGETRLSFSLLSGSVLSLEQVEEEGQITTRVWDGPRLTNVREVRVACDICGQRMVEHTYGAKMHWTEVRDRVISQEDGE